MKNVKYGIIVLAVLVAFAVGLFGFLTGCGGTPSSSSSGSETMTITNISPYAIDQ